MESPNPKFYKYFCEGCQSCGMNQRAHKGLYQRYCALKDKVSDEEHLHYIQHLENRLSDSTKPRQYQRRFLALMDSAVGAEKQDHHNKKEGSIKDFLKNETMKWEVKQLNKYLDKVKTLIVKHLTALQEKTPTSAKLLGNFDVDLVAQCLHLRRYSKKDLHFSNRQSIEIRKNIQWSYVALRKVERAIQDADRRGRLRFAIQVDARMLMKRANQTADCLWELAKWVNQKTRKLR